MSVVSAAEAPVEVTGICLRDAIDGTPTGRADVSAGIRLLADRGGGTLHLPSLTVVDPALNRAVLQSVAAEAAAADVTITTSLPPAHPDRLEATWGADPSAPSHPFAHLAASADLGVHAFHTTVGVESDRWGGPPSWKDQLSRSVVVLRQLAARAEAPLVLKSHEEMTSDDLETLLDQVPRLTLGFSPVNIVTRLEDPLEVARRLSSSIHSFFVDDCVVSEEPLGLARRMRAIGTGDIDWPALVALAPTAPRIIDLHRADLRMPIWDEHWWTHEPHVTGAALARLLRSAKRRTDRSEHDLGSRTAAARRLLLSTRR